MTPEEFVSSLLCPIPDADRAMLICESTEELIAKYDAQCTKLEESLPSRSTEFLNIIRDGLLTIFLEYQASHVERKPYKRISDNPGKTQSTNIHKFMEELEQKSNEVQEIYRITRLVKLYSSIVRELVSRNG